MQKTLNKLVPEDSEVIFIHPTQHQDSQLLTQIHEIKNKKSKVVNSMHVSKSILQKEKYTHKPKSQSWERHVLRG